MPSITNQQNPEEELQSEGNNPPNDNEIKSYQASVMERVGRSVWHERGQWQAKDPQKMFYLRNPPFRRQLQFYEIFRETRTDGSHTNQVSFLPILLGYRNLREPDGNGYPNIRMLSRFLSFLLLDKSYGSP